jgi:hypothetical protein
MESVLARSASSISLILRRSGPAKMEALNPIPWGQLNSPGKTAIRNLPLYRMDRQRRSSPPTLRFPLFEPKESQPKYATGYK